MLILKRFPQNFRALLLVFEDILRSTVLKSDYTNDVMSILQNRTDENEAVCR